jgi:hypothetical protein
VIHPSRRALPNGALLSLLLAIGLAAAGSAMAAPRLVCTLVQGATSKRIEVAPTADPYGVTAQQVNHFRFKAVVVGNAGHVDYVNLYTYYETARGGVEAGGDKLRLVHVARHVAPPLQQDGASLTGTVYVYEPRLGREFSFDCALREVAA